MTKRKDIVALYYSLITPQNSSFSIHSQIKMTADIYILVKISRTVRFFEKLTMKR